MFTQKQKDYKVPKDVKKIVLKSKNDQEMKMSSCRANIKVY